MNYIQALQNPIFKIIAKASKELNVDSYVIGGFVRDFILQRDFKKDIDIVSVGSGIDLAIKVSELLPKNPKVQIFKTYGTAMLYYNGIDIEFVGARKESYNLESRNPIVENGTLKDDQDRRDFTINAMAASVNADCLGELIDHFGGVQDLAAGILRTPLDPAVTFSDDPLRMMRAARFAARLGVRLDDAALRRGWVLAILAGEDVRRGLLHALKRLGVVLLRPQRRAVVVPHRQADVLPHLTAAARLHAAILERGA